MWWFWCTLQCCTRVARSQPFTFRVRAFSSHAMRALVVAALPALARGRLLPSGVPCTGAEAAGVSPLFKQFDDSILNLYLVQFDLVINPAAAPTGGLPLGAASSTHARCWSLAAHDRLGGGGSRQTVLPTAWGLVGDALRAVAGSGADSTPGGGHRRDSPTGDTAEHRAFLALLDIQARLERMAGAFAPGEMHHDAFLAWMDDCVPYTVATLHLPAYDHHFSATTAAEKRVLDNESEKIRCRVGGRPPSFVS